MTLTKAFYGLAHSPRKRNDFVVSFLLENGWEQLKSDRCVFALQNKEGVLCALSGLHVDDFLLAGLPECDLYFQTKKLPSRANLDLIWQMGERCRRRLHLRRLPETGVSLDQEECVNEWVQEIPLSPV